MLVSITDKGVLVRRLPLPGLGRLIPFDEIEGISGSGNGSSGGFTLFVAGGRPLRVKGMPEKEAARIVEAVSLAVDPPLSRQDGPLGLDGFREAAGWLCSQAGARPGPFLRFLLDQAVFLRASDVHLLSGEGEAALRLRIDGMLLDMAGIPKEMAGRLLALAKNRAGLASYRHDTPQEGAFSHEGPGGKAVWVRVSAVPARGGESLVLRLFTQLADGDLGSLGFGRKSLGRYTGLIEKPGGLVVLSGPSASGKTTTLYASLRHLMEGPKKGLRAVTLEDPVEHPLACATQTEVAEHKGLGFDRLLGAALRQDVNVILVGEVRDRATAKIALTAALTGHLILTTAHCARACQVPRRLSDLGMEPAGLAEALSGAMAQRLVRVLCPKCKKPDPAAGPGAFLPVGCPGCMGTGFSGRTALAECLVADPGISEMLREGAAEPLLERTARDGGMVTLAEDAGEKVRRGLTCPEEIKRVLG